MAQGTQTAAEVARTLSRNGRVVTAKRVRSWAREHIGRYDDDKYTSHAYTPAEVRAIVAGFGESKSRAAAQTKSKPKSKPKGTRAQVNAAAVVESVEAAS